MKICTALLLLGVLISPVSHSASEVHYLKKGMSFVKAHQLILKDGWVANPDKGARDDELKKKKKRLVDKGFKEVEYCFVDSSACTFKYRNNESCLQIVAKGEKISELKLSYWTHDCKPDS